MSFCFHPHFDQVAAASGLEITNSEITVDSTQKSDQDCFDIVTNTNPNLNSADFLFQLVLYQIKAFLLSKFDFCWLARVMVFELYVTLVNFIHQHGVERGIAYLLNFKDYNISDRANK